MRQAVMAWNGGPPVIGRGLVRRKDPPTADVSLTRAFLPEFHSPPSGQIPLHGMGRHHRKRRMIDLTNSAADAYLGDSNAVSFWEAESNRILRFCMSVRVR